MSLHMHRPVLQHVDPPDLYAAATEVDPIIAIGRQGRADHLALLRTQQAGIRAVVAEDPKINDAVLAALAEYRSPATRGAAEPHGTEGYDVPPFEVDLAAILASERKAAEPHGTEGYVVHTANKENPNA